MIGRKKKKTPQTMLSSALFTALPAFTATRGVHGPTGATGPAYLTGGYPVQEPEPRQIEDLGLSIEPIVGIRAFTVYHGPEGPELFSFNDTLWPYRRPLQAVCGNNPFTDHEVPAEDCRCGIYAWKLKEARSCTGQAVTGEINMWGDILICDLGYRAEFAYPKSLTITAVATRAAMRIRDGLEEGYGVPVALVDPPPTPPIEENEIVFNFNTGRK